MTELDVDYPCFWASLQQQMESVSDDEDVPLVVAILAEDYFSHLHYLYELWRKQKRPMHIIAVDTAYTSSAKRLSKYSGEIYRILERYWPLALPGLHRIDVSPYQFSVSVLFASSIQHWKQICANVHWFICDEDIPLEAIRMSVPNPCVIGKLSHQQHILNKLQGQQFSLVSMIKGAEYGLFLWKSHRPVLDIPARRGREVVVIGAGVAGAGVAFALAERGWKVKVVDPIFNQHIPDTEAYHYASGAVTPLVTADDSHKARLSRAGILRAKARWRAIFSQVGIRECGTLELNRDKGHAKDLLESVQGLDFPEEWVRLVSADKGGQLAGVPIEQPGAFFPWAMQIPPVKLAYMLLQHPNIACYPITIHRILPQDKEGFKLEGDTAEGDRTTLETKVVVVANAMNSLSLLKQSQLDVKVSKSGKVTSALGRLESLHALAGEVMMIPQQLVKGGPRCVIGGQGYYLPKQEGFCVMGSTYEHGNLHPQITQKGQQAIWQKMPISLPTTLEDLQASGLLKGRACVRAVVQGRLPVIAELKHSPGLWLTCAYASHGMTWSSLAGDIIGASLEGEPLPIEKDLLDAVSLEG